MPHGQSDGGSHRQDDRAPTRRFSLTFLKQTADTFMEAFEH
tara:strand:- start:101 stop:223 length:123 start_codon:yes stop_codon:yes gene_type:complete